MKYSRIFTLALTFLLPLSGITISIYSSGFNEYGNNENSIINDENLIPKVSYTSHNPIRIDNNTDFANQASLEGWNGNGTEGDPYIIEGYEIDGGGYGYCVYIGNTTDYFVVRNCYLYNSSENYDWPYSANTGFHLYYVKNGTLENSELSSNEGRDVLFYYSNGSSMQNNNIITGGWIDIHHSHNITLSNNNLTYISLYNSPRTNISENNIGGGDQGICLLSSDESMIINNTISDTAGRAIFIKESKNISLINNDLSGSYGGIFARKLRGTKIINNRISNMYSEGIFIRNCNSPLIKNNSISNPLSNDIYNGIYLENTPQPYIINNTLNKSKIWYGNCNYSQIINNTVLESFIVTSNLRDIIIENNLLLESNVSLTDINNAKINNNDFSSKGHIRLREVHNSTISNNSISNIIAGISSRNSYNIIIKDNILKNTGKDFIGTTGYSISLTYTNYSTIASNTISSVSNGIDISPSNHNELYNNIVSNVGGRGISVTGSGNKIFSNTIYNASQTIELYKADNNLIYHNNFIREKNSNYPSEDNGNNTWDKGYPSGGNFWSVYEGIDRYNGINQDEKGSDGIGDEPFYIEDGENKDQYPVMKPFEGVLKISDQEEPMIKDMSSNTGYTGDNYTISSEITDNVNVNRVNLSYWFKDEADNKSQIILDRTEKGNRLEYKIQFPPNSTTPFYYNISATDALENINFTGIKKVNVVDNDNPIPVIGDDLSILEGESVIFNASKSYDNIGIVNYTWSFKDTSEIVLYGKETNYIFNNSGDYPVNLRIYDSAGNNETAVKQIEVIEDTDRDGDPDSIDLDDDNDGMPDEWEEEHGLNSTDSDDADIDSDEDGLTNIEEFEVGTDPNNPDSDGDGVLDGKDDNPLEPKSNMIWWVLGIVGIIIVVVFFFFKKQKVEPEKESPEESFEESEEEESISDDEV